MPKRAAPAETTADQWEVVAWIAANVDTAAGLIAGRRAIDRIPADAFTDDDAALAYMAIRDTIQLDSPSLAEIVAAIRRHPGGATFNRARFIDTINATATSHVRLLEEATEAILESHRQRQYLDAIADAQAGCVDPESRLAAVNRIIAAAHSATATDDDIDAVSIAERWAADDDERLIVTGFPALDRRFGGGLPTGITAICAMPGAGKSALAGMLMLGALLHDPKLVAIWFRGEMSDRLLWSRFVATWSSMRSPAVPTVTRKEASKRTKSARTVSADLANVVGGRLKIVTPPLSSDRVSSAINRHKPGLVVIDYLQKMSAAGFQDKRTELDHAVSVVTDLTTKNDIATIIVSSMAGRHTSSKAGSDIGGMTKESNRLDYDAHNYMALWSDKADKEKDPRPVRLEITKARTGGEGAVDLWFTGSGQYFTPQAREAFETEAPPAGRYTEFDDFSVEANA